MNVRSNCTCCNQSIEYDGNNGGVLVFCPTCNGQTFLPQVVQPMENKVKIGTVKCSMCQSDMVKTKRVDKNMLHQVFGVFVFLFGLCLCFSIIGALLGIPLMIIAARLGYKKEKVWMCNNCGFFYKI